MSPAEPNHDKPDRISWNDAGEIFASLPYLLGFHPVDSLVVVAMNRVTSTVVAVARVSLPDPTNYHAAATRLSTAMSSRGLLSVLLMVIADRSGEDIPHRALIDECTAVFDRAGVPVIDAWWAAACAAGSPWHCYRESDHTGAVSDPTASSVAAHSVAAGHITYNSREEMAALLSPEPDDVLARRAALLASVPAGHRRHPADRYLQYCEIDRAIRNAYDGVLPKTDDEIVRLVLALRDLAIRDACLLQNEGVFRDGAEQLWRYLVRAVPGHDRAEPAVLLAISAYLQGNGVLAGMALQCATDASPENSLAALVTEALAYGMPLTQFRHAINCSAIESLDEIMKSMP